MSAGSVQRPLTRGHYAILLGAALAVSMAAGVALPLLPFIIERVRGAGAVAAHTGTITAVYTVASLIFTPLWGSLSDRAGRRLVIAIGLAGSTASLSLLDFAPTLPVLYLARGLSGALSAAVMPAVLAFVAESSAQRVRPRRLAAVAAAATMGFVLGPLIGGWLGPMVVTPVAGMRVAGLLMMDSPFLATGAVGLLAAALLSLLPAGQGQVGSARGNVVVPKSKAVIMTGLLVTGIAVFGITVAEVGITVMGKQTLQLDAAGINRFFMVCGAIMILVQTAIFPIFIERFALFKLVKMSLLGLTVGLAVLPFVRQGVGLMAAFGLVSAGTALLIPALTTSISNAAGPAQGKVMAQQFFAANFGQAVAALLTGFLFDVAPAAPFLLGAAVAATGMLVAYRIPSENCQPHFRAK